MPPLKTYEKLLKTHFLLVQSTQTAIMMGMGDFLAQKVIEKKPWKDYNFRRTAEFLFLGGALVGPASTAWYKFLQRQYGSEKKLDITVKKMLTDQLVFAPGFLVVVLTTLGIMHNKDMEGIKKDFETKYLDIVITNWKVWPAVQLVNFYFLPLKYQIVFVQGVAIFWNTYFAWKTGHSE